MLAYLSYILALAMGFEVLYIALMIIFFTICR